MFNHLYKSPIYRGLNQRPVVNSLFSSDQKLKLYITNIKSNDYNIELYENNKLVDILSYINKEYYSSNIILKQNNIYTVKINENNINILEVSDIIHEVTEIINTHLEPVSKYSISGTYIGNRSTATIEFKDSINIQNYYEILLYIVEFNYEDPNTGVKYDSIYRLINITSEDPVIIAEGLNLLRTKSIVFSDILFDGETIAINIDFGMQCYWCNKKFYVVLRTVSYNYYMYIKSLLLYFAANSTESFEDISDLTRYIFVSEPIKIYSNINNGLGIFAGYSECIKELTLDEE